MRTKFHLATTKEMLFFCHKQTKGYCCHHSQVQKPSLWFAWEQMSKENLTEGYFTPYSLKKKKKLFYLIKNNVNAKIYNMEAYMLSIMHTPPGNHMSGYSWTKKNSFGLDIYCFFMRTKKYVF